MALTSIQLIDIVQFEKISITSPRKVNENSKREGVQKQNFAKEGMALDWNFQRGWGFKLKNLP